MFARLRPALRSLPKRRSSWLSRSPKSVPGETRLTVTFAEPPDSGRPSDGWIDAFGALKFAAIWGPGMLCNVPLTRTSMRGIVYDASPLIWLRKFVSTWQYCVGVTVDAAIRTSGTFAAIAQLSVDVRPVLSPPCTRRPCDSLALPVMSTPFQCSYWLP